MLVQIVTFEYHCVTLIIAMLNFGSCLAHLTGLNLQSQIFRTGYILPPNFVVPASLLHTFVCSGILFVNSCFLILTAQSITGKSILLLEKTDLKEMDILMGGWNSMKR